MSSQTTSLDSLPISPQTNNIQLETTENIKIDSVINNIQEQRTNDDNMNQQNMNSFVTGVQKAASDGMLSLQSRDIPQNNSHITRDPEIQPNFIPKTDNTDYIGDDISTDEMIRKNTRKKQFEEKTNNLLNDLEVPIILSILYFIFQLPIVKSSLNKYIPSFFQKDGNFNLSGYLFTSLAFGAVYMLLRKGMEYVNE